MIESCQLFRERCNAHYMRKRYEDDQHATPAGESRLARMPKIANLATAGHFHKTHPIVSDRAPDTSVSFSTQTSSELSSLNSLCTDGRQYSPTNHLPICDHRQSHAVIRGRAMPVCLHCSDYKATFHAPQSSTVLPSSTDAKIVVGARPLLHTMQGFPFDLRCSGVEASRLMNLPLEIEEGDQMQGRFGQRQLTLSRSHARRFGTRRVRGG
jgi:hypothetical protein